jgi:hypothetical protein
LQYLDGGVAVVVQAVLGGVYLAGRGLAQVAAGAEVEGVEPAAEAIDCLSYRQDEGFDLLWSTGDGVGLARPEGGDLVLDRGEASRCYDRLLGARPLAGC